MAADTCLRRRARWGGGGGAPGRPAPPRRRSGTPRPCALAPRRPRGRNPAAWPGGRPRAGWREWAGGWRKSGPSRSPGPAVRPAPGLFCPARPSGQRPGPAGARRSEPPVPAGPPSGGGRAGGGPGCGPTTRAWPGQERVPPRGEPGRDQSGGGGERRGTRRGERRPECESCTSYYQVN